MFVAELQQAVGNSPAYSPEADTPCPTEPRAVIPKLKTSFQLGWILPFPLLQAALPVTRHDLPPLVMFLCFYENLPLENVLAGWLTAVFLSASPEGPGKAVFS